MEPLEIDFTRHNPGIDPGIEIWALPIPLYLFVGGLTAGLMVFSTLLELRGARPTSAALRFAPFLGFGLLSLGMLALFVDLSHPLYVWRFYLAFKPESPMSWGAWIVMAVFGALLLQGVGGATTDERARVTGWLGPAAPLAERLAAFADTNRRGILIANAALGVGLGVYTGLLLGTAPARILWNSALLGPLFLASGLSAGAALLLLFPLSDVERHAAARFDLQVMVLEAVLLALFLIGLATGGTPQRAAVAELLTGEWAPPFWALVVFVGLVTPIGLDLVESWRHRPFLRLGPVLVLVGSLSLRMILVAAGQEISFAHLP